MANPTLNRVELKAFLAASPDMRNLPSGDICANLAAYTKRGYKQDGKLIIERERHQLVAFGDVAHVGPIPTFVR